MSSSQRDRLATLPKLESPTYHSSPFDTVTTIFIELIFHYIYFFFRRTCQSESDGLINLFLSPFIGM